MNRIYGVWPRRGHGCARSCAACCCCRFMPLLSVYAVVVGLFTARTRSAQILGVSARNRKIHLRLTLALRGRRQILNIRRVAVHRFQPFARPECARPAEKPPQVPGTRGTGWGFCAVQQSACLRSRTVSLRSYSRRRSISIRVLNRGRGPRGTLFQGRGRNMRSTLDLANPTLVAPKGAGQLRRTSCVLLREPCRCRSLRAYRASPRHTLLRRGSGFLCAAVPTILCALLLSGSACALYTLGLRSTLATASKVPVSPCACRRCSVGRGSCRVAAYRAVTCRGVLCCASANRIQGNLWLAPLTRRPSRALCPRFAAAERRLRLGVRRQGQQRD